MKALLQKCTGLIFAVALMLVCLPQVALAQDNILEGAGTKEQPYVIRDAEDLLDISKNMKASYVLAADISPEEWTAPISTTGFSGTLDGNGYTITLPAGATASLFSGNLSGTVKNLNLYAPKLTLNRVSSGVLTSGTNLYVYLTGTVDNCSVKGNLELTATGAGIHAGGFAPAISSTGKITNSYASVTLDKTGTGGTSKYYAGALVGYANQAKFEISNSSWNQKLTADSVGAYGVTDGEAKNTAVATGADYTIYSLHKDILADASAASLTAEKLVGGTLTASDTDSSQKERTYSWYRSGKYADTLVREGKENTYLLTSEDVGYRIKVVISGEEIVGSREASSKTIKDNDTYQVSLNTEPGDAAVIVKNTAGYVVGTGSSLSLYNGTYQYYVGKSGYKAVSGKLVVNGAAVEQNITLTADAITGFTWTETYNMAVTTDAAVASGLPKGTDDGVYTKWATHVGTSFTHEVTNAVFLNDYIYIVGALGGTGSKEFTLRKLDPATGKILAEKKMTDGNYYNYFLQTAGDMIVVQEGLTVEAFDADLNSLWVTESMASGNQGLTPLTYADGVIYGGTVGVGAYTGCYFAVSAADGSILWKNEVDPDMVYCGSSSKYTGYYWAGSAVIGDYLVYGGEGGRVYSVDRLTGEVIDRYDICDDATHSIRCSVSYDGAKVYFTDTFGTIYQIPYAAADGTFGETGSSNQVGEQPGNTSFGSTCTATPVIYNGRVYIGDATSIAVFKASDMSLIYRVNHKVGTLRDLRLVADTAENCVYVYTNYYSTPGSIVMLKDAPGQTSGTLVDFAPLTTQWKQYNASMPIWGPDGTIYLTNDLGYLIAIGRGEAWLSSMKGNGSLDHELNNGITDYELVVTPGTAQAELDLQVSAGATLKVNGEVITVTEDQAKVTVPLTDGVAQADIQVEKNGSSREYKVSVREASQDASIKDVKISQSNSFNSGVKAVTALSEEVFICYGQNSTFMRLWETRAKAATSKLYALGGVGSKSKITEDGVVGNTAAGAGAGIDYLRWNLYWENNTMTLQLEVTAEDGVTKKSQYYIITQLSQAAFAGSAQELEAMSLIMKDTKTAALAELDSYYGQLDQEAYYEAQQLELSELLAQGKKNINLAVSEQGIAQALSAAKDALQTVETKAQLLAKEKETAKEALQSYLSLDAYRPEQRQEILDILTTYGSKIDEAADSAAVQDVVAQAKADLDLVKTDAQVTAEEQAAAELLAVMNDARDQLNAYVNMSQYRETQRRAIEVIKTKFAEEVYTMTSREEVASLLDAAKADIDEIKTDAQLTAEELKQAKTVAENRISTLVALNNYRQAQQQEIAALIQNYSEKINAAASEAEVRSLALEAETALLQVKTDAQLTAQEAQNNQNQNGDSDGQGDQGQSGNSGNQGQTGNQSGQGTNGGTADAVTNQYTQTQDDGADAQDAGDEATPEDQETDAAGTGEDTGDDADAGDDQIDEQTAEFDEEQVPLASIGEENSSSMGILAAAIAVVVILVAAIAGILVYNKKKTV